VSNKDTTEVEVRVTAAKTSAVIEIKTFSGEEAYLRDIKGLLGRSWIMARSCRAQVDHLIPHAIRLTLTDPWGTAERIALELMECTSEQRDDFVRKCGRIWKTIAHSNGCSEMVAVDFALLMQRLIGEVVSEIEASSGGKVGTAWAEICGRWRDWSNEQHFEEVNVAYFVTHGVGPAAIDGGFDFEGAIIHAYRLMDEGKLDVAIQDELGNSIRGDELAACHRGEKRLSTDLRAISN
jgi:hypothetical protein